MRKSSNIAEAAVFFVFCPDYHRWLLPRHKKEQTLDEVMQDIDNIARGSRRSRYRSRSGCRGCRIIGIGNSPYWRCTQMCWKLSMNCNFRNMPFPMLGLCIGYPASRRTGIKASFSTTGCLFSKRHKTDLKDKLAEYDVIYAHYLKERPWNNRVGNWTDLAADFYRHPFHYKGVADALSQQGFTSAKSRYSV